MRDRFLVTIVAGVILLVVTSFVIVLARPEVGYRNDDTPEAAVHNYLLALHREEYDRAYAYLSPALPGYPQSLTAFVEDVLDNQYGFYRNRDFSLEVQPTPHTDTYARIKVLQTNFSSDIFGGSQYDTEFDMRLRREGDQWRIIEGDSFWVYCWEKTVCP